MKWYKRDNTLNNREWYKPTPTMQIYDYLQKVKHNNQIETSIRKLAKETKLNKIQIEWAIKNLKDSGDIKLNYDKNRKSTIITIVEKWENDKPKSVKNKKVKPTKSDKVQMDTEEFYKTELECNNTAQEIKAYRYAVGIIMRSEKLKGMRGQISFKYYEELKRQANKRGTGVHTELENINGGYIKRNTRLDETLKQNIMKIQPNINQ